MKSPGSWQILTTMLVFLVLRKVANCANCVHKVAVSFEDPVQRSEESFPELETAETSNVPYHSSSLQFLDYSRRYSSEQSQGYSYDPPSLSQFSYELNGTGNGQDTTCGDYFPRLCRNSRYRTMDGSCNNLQYPTWGMANTRFGRLLPANYGNGISSQPHSVNGFELPLARLLSFTLFPEADVNDPVWTLAAMQWGQIITHDMSSMELNIQTEYQSSQCCTSDGQLGALSGGQHGNCPIIVTPYDDPVYSKANIKCWNYIPSTNDIERGCKAPYNPAEQLSSVTHFLDLSLVYGSSDESAAKLRSGYGGRLRVDIRQGSEWPPSAFNNSTDCANAVCYQTGDARTNQNPQLAVLQILLLREHNRVARALAELNPHWTDETIYQETRRIVIAEHQHISYYEWLPIFLGTQSAYDNKILYDAKGYVDDYDPSVNPNVLNEHANAAFRYFHSLIAGYLNLVNENWYANGVARLSDHFGKPAILEQGDNFDGLTRGLASQLQKASDIYFDPEVTKYFARNGRDLGIDLRSIDIQRARTHGIASYNKYREYCGLPRATYFSDFTDTISPLNVKKLLNLYASPDDVELAVGGSLELHVPGALVGPTYLCILSRQFYRTRVGDRYWYERGDHPLAFTPRQLNEIRKSSISRLFCDNGNNIKTMQPSGFRKISSINPITSCDNIPAVDLSAWKDYQSYDCGKNNPPCLRYR